jgi:dsDNA-binding SOS-regulon protein
MTEVSTVSPEAARNATLEDLVATLQGQQPRKLDVVAGAAAIRSEGGVIRLSGTEWAINEDGAVQQDGLYRPTDVCDTGISAKLRIPLDYLRRMRNEVPALYDANVNGWLERDDRKFMLRCFRPDDDGGEGVARAFVSNSYGIIDYLDALTSALAGVRQAGVPVVIDGCDLTEKRMYVRVVCEAVQALAPSLLAGYRSPYSGETGTDNPTVFAGFVISDSEVGHGQFSITPRLVAQVCRNGMTITRDAVGKQHLGARLDEGIVRWTDETRQKELALITAQARDTVATFLDTGYVVAKLAEMEEQAGIRVKEPIDTIEHVSKGLAFTEEQQKDVLSFFFRSDQLTAGGVMHAVTAAAQQARSGDTAFDMEANGLRAMQLAAAFNA